MRLTRELLLAIIQENGSIRQKDLIDALEPQDINSSAVRKMLSKLEDVGLVEIVSRGVYQLKDNETKQMQHQTTKIYEPVIPKNVITVQEKPLQVETPNALILGDLHAPYHHRDMLRKALVLTQRDYPWIEDVVLNGDTFNFERISRWGQDTPASTLAQDLRKGREIVKEIARIFPRVYVIAGNHDQRWAKKLDAVVTMEDLLMLDLPTKVFCSDFEYCYVGENWLVVHPRKYNSTPARTAAELCMLEQKNVITGHSHVLGMSQSKCGKFQAIDAGHMTNPDQHFYLKSGMTTFPKWSAGFVIISNGYAHQYSEKFTNWEMLNI